MLAAIDFKKSNYAIVYFALSPYNLMLPVLCSEFDVASLFAMLTLLISNYQLQVLTSCRIFFPVAIFGTFAAADSVTTVTTQLTVVKSFKEVVERAAGTGSAVTSLYFTAVNIIFQQFKKTKQKKNKKKHNNNR